MGILINGTGVFPKNIAVTRCRYPGVLGRWQHEA